jgi:hypothetical protein
MPGLTGNRCECTACGEYFSSERSFDRHRIGQFGIDRRCMTADAMTADGWARNDRGFWLTPDPRRAGADIPAPRTYAARVKPTPAPDTPETRGRASQSATGAMP